MSGLKKEQIREAVFGQYGRLVHYASDKFPFLSKRGISVEELVNEAVVGIFDVKTEFKSKEEIYDFLCKTIYLIGFAQKEELYDSNFLIQVSKSNKEYNILDGSYYPPVAPSKEIQDVYDIFERERWGRREEKRQCNKCGCKKLHNMRGKFVEYVRCQGCFNRQSITAKTYFSNSRLTYLVLYKFLLLICRDDKLSSYKLAKIIGCTQATAWNRRLLIRSAICAVKSKKPNKVLYKILTQFDKDKTPVKLLRVGFAKLSTEDICEIKRLVNNKILKPKDVAEYYLTDLSTIYKIAKGQAYKDTKERSPFGRPTKSKRLKIFDKMESLNSDKTG